MSVRNRNINDVPDWVIEAEHNGDDQIELAFADVAESALVRARNEIERQMGFGICNVPEECVAVIDRMIAEFYVKPRS